MKTIILSLITITACLLLTGCGGGGGGGGGSGGPGKPPFPAEVELSISPFDGGLHIQWHNLPAIERTGGIYIHLNLTSNDIPPQPVRERIAIGNLTSNGYEIKGLVNGTAYRLVEVRVELPGNISRIIDNIKWSEPWQAKTNALDQEGNGTVVGTNHDGDGRTDKLDADIDDDGVNNTHANGTVWDLCRRGELDWLSDITTDNDGDGCRDDSSEDLDDDNDGLIDNHPSELLVNTDGISCSLLKNCDNDGVLNEDEIMDCVRDEDCDKDRVLDGDELADCVRKPNCDSDSVNDNEDIDDDGDGLIEIHNAAELDAVRWDLNGTGFKANNDSVLNQNGCGGGGGMTVCNGYELVRDISLSDHITKTHGTAGWKPIASDTAGSTGCQGDKFAAIFDGNGFEISGLFIDRSREDCIGLFGQVNGTIHHLGVVADKIEGRDFVGGLVGWGLSASIVQSYGVSNSLRGRGNVGGLVGWGTSASIVHSYAVSNSVRGRANSVGGLVGWGTSASIVQSYAVSNLVRGASGVGGLVGWGQSASIVQSYGVSNLVSGTGDLGGLVGWGLSASIVHSYAVSGGGELSGTRPKGLVGFLGSADTSYWDTETSGETTGGAGSMGQTTSALRSPTDYTGIYDEWDAGAIMEGDTIAGVDRDGTIYCDEDNSGMIETDERRGDGDTNGDNRVWDFGTSTDYPAIRCTPDNPADQRAWWYLNDTSNEPQLDQTRLDDYLDGTLP